MVIDFHTHAFPDQLAPRAIPTLAARAQLAPQTDGTVADLLCKMDVWGVDRSVICNIATNPKQQDNVNRFAAEVNRLHSDRLTALWSVHPDSETIGETLAAAAAAGVPGIKLHPDYMGYDFSNPVFDPILEECQRLGLFVLIHAGFDVLSPDHLHATPEMIRRRVEAYPGLRLVAAHFGSNCRWDEVEQELIGTDVYFDTSLGCVYDLPADKAREMILRHDPQRILFGSDCPWCAADRSLAYLRSLALPETLEEKILHGNAENLLRLSGK